MELAARRTSADRKSGLNYGPPNTLTYNLAWNAQIDRERMAEIPARQSSVIYTVGETALTVAAARSIIRKRALASADMGLVDLMGRSSAKRLML